MQTVVLIQVGKLDDDGRFHSDNPPIIVEGSQFLTVKPQDVSLPVDTYNTIVEEINNNGAA